MSRSLATPAICSVIGLALFAVAGACSDGRDGFEERPRNFVQTPTEDAGECALQCSLDGRSVIRSCTGETVETCSATTACGGAKCQDPCAAAAEDRSSNGCEFYFQAPPPYASSCYATFVVNTSTQPVELSFDRDGEALDISKAVFRTTPGDATLLAHTGPIPPGESVVLFVEERDPSTPNAINSVRCPEGVVPAVQGKALTGTAFGKSFHLATNAPVSLVAMYPFGGAAGHLPTTALLMPVVTWGKEHVIVNPWEANIGRPSTQIVASEDGTEITIVPKVPIQSGQGVEGALANLPATYRLDKGQFLQFVQNDELTGSILTSSKPTATFGGQTCAYIPSASGACDLLWQQIPSHEQWGSEYVAVGYRQRTASPGETMPYRIVAAHDGTRLDYDPKIPVGAPTEMNAGEVVTFPAGVNDTFVVRTQDAEHPIYLAAYMTGYEGGYYGSGKMAGWGDPDFVNVVPAGQWLNAYSFYADPTYEETSLVVIRGKHFGKFEDVWLECAGTLTDWKPVGTRVDYEYVRVDLSREGGPGQSFGDKTCRTGLQRMKSTGPFTATLWGWAFAASYAYPGGTATRKLVTTPLVPVQ
ncbi:MAG: IgGFc-binding protein [Myxococcales bacterium]|nr:IgGFc-binding protein [Myxococcales bacterium]